LNAAKRAPLNRNADFNGARYDKNTVWPEGFPIPPEANSD